jgi:glyoxylase-like metal-dependent hydrolase (beta-lactamase superfamily II)
MKTVVKVESMQIDQYQLGPFGTNTYILTCRKTGASAVVDAPASADRIMAGLRGTQPQFILMTHGHFDHVGALSELKAALNVPVAAHASDAASLPVKPDMVVNDGEEISLGDVKVQVLHTPGHTEGSLCYLADLYLIAGDTLFPGGPGHTQSPADLQQILASITKKIFTLPDETVVFPGHGEATTVGKAKAEYRVFSSQTHAPNLCGDVLWESS